MAQTVGQAVEQMPYAKDHTPWTSAGMAVTLGWGAYAWMPQSSQNKLKTSEALGDAWEQSYFLVVLLASCFCFGGDLCGIRRSTRAGQGKVPALSSAEARAWSEV